MRAGPPSQAPKVPTPLGSLFEGARILSTKNPWQPLSEGVGMLHQPTLGTPARLYLKGLAYCINQFELPLAAASCLAVASR